MGVCYNCSTRVSLWMAEESDLVMPARITRTFGAIAAVGVLGVTGTVGARAALACPPKSATAYVVNQFANTVTPINRARVSATVR